MRRRSPPSFRALFALLLGASSLAACSLPAYDLGGRVNRPDVQDIVALPETGVDVPMVDPDVVDPDAGCDVDATITCYTGAPGTMGVGACHAGVQRCTSEGVFAMTCEGQVVPTADETCGNNLDDDCNGMVDENCGDCLPGNSRECYTGPAGTPGFGPCRKGTQFCTSARTWSADCLGQVLPAAETCNGVDDDCNGTPDDLGTTSCGLGACRRSVSACVDGGMPVCTPGTAGTETCNGVDDDCDGTVDDGSLCTSPQGCYRGRCCLAPAASCLAVGSTCCVGSCVRGTCECTAGGGTCRSAAECCSGTCSLGTCACVRSLGRCTVGFECCSGSCLRGSCQ